TEGAKSFANLELIIPIVFFVVSAAALCLYRMWQTRSAILKGLAGVLMIAICLADVASFGFFYEWNIVPADLPEKLADAPTVKFIKDREPNLNSFRIMGQAAWPYYHNYEKLNFPNVSVVRGLQSVNGYDPLLLNRYAELAGTMTLDGLVNDPT